MDKDKITKFIELCSELDETSITTLYVQAQALALRKQMERNNKSEKVG